MGRRFFIVEEIEEIKEENPKGFGCGMLILLVILMPFSSLMIERCEGNNSISDTVQVQQEESVSKNVQEEVYKPQPIEINNASVDTEKTDVKLGDVIENINKTEAEELPTAEIQQFENHQTAKEQRKAERKEKRESRRKAKKAKQE